MPSRHLVSIRRHVPPEERRGYDAAWQRLHTAATTLDAHAWRFRSAVDSRVFLEFLEFASDQDPRQNVEVATALRDLASRFGSPSPSAEPLEEWLELRE